jgi:hypothetical protein
MWMKSGVVSDVDRPVVHHQMVKLYMHELVLVSAISAY